MDIVNLGVGLAFVAMLSWGIGDFFIQKSVRRVGNVEALLYMSIFGAVVLSPFVYKNIPALFMGSWQILAVLGILCVVLFIASLLDFEALKIGKLSVIEPIWSFEVPVSALLAFILLGEVVTLAQAILIASLLLGLILISLRNKIEFRKLILEKGAMIALAGAIFMGASNFLMGWSSRLSDPLMANFITDVFMIVILTMFLVGRGRLKRTIKNFSLNKTILIQMSVLDNTAWVAFAFAMSLAPIGVIVALSESYIIIAVILGLMLNRERLILHQKVGLVMAIISAIILAAITA